MLVNLPLFSLTDDVIEHLLVRNFFSSPMGFMRKQFITGGWKLLLSGKVDALSILRRCVARVRVRALAMVRSARMVRMSKTGSMNRAIAAPSPS